MKHLKLEFDKLSFRETVVITLAIICQITATVAIFLGMYLEPRGEIHASVLTYYGIASSFTGALLGISFHYSAELSNFKNQIKQMIDGAVAAEPNNSGQKEFRQGI